MSKGKLRFSRYLARLAAAAKRPRVGAILSGLALAACIATAAAAALLPGPIGVPRISSPSIPRTGPVTLVRPPTSTAVPKHRAAAQSGNNSLFNRSNPLLVQAALYPDGIFPGEIHTVEGFITINFADYTGGSTGVQINDPNGKQYAQILRNNGPWNVSGTITMTPGVYTLFDLSNPTNQATIKVSP